MFGTCHCCADMNGHSWSIIPIVEPQVCCMWFGGPTSWCNVTRLCECHLSRLLWLAMEWLCVLYAQDMFVHLEAVFGCAWWLFSCICCALMRLLSKSAMAASVIWFCFSWIWSAMGVFYDIYRACCASQGCYSVWLPSISPMMHPIYLDPWWSLCWCNLRCVGCGRAHCMCLGTIKSHIP